MESSPLGNLTSREKVLVPPKEVKCITHVHNYVNVVLPPVHFAAIFARVKLFLKLAGLIKALQKCSAVWNLFSSEHI